MSSRKSDASATRTIARLYNNLSLGKSRGKYGEHFVCFAIDYLANIDERTRRYIMCDLIVAGLQTSERYGSQFNKLKEEYLKQFPLEEEEA